MDKNTTPREPVRLEGALLRLGVSQPSVELLLDTVPATPDGRQVKWAIAQEFASENVPVHLVKVS